MVKAEKHIRRVGMGPHEAWTRVGEALQRVVEAADEFSRVMNWVVQTQMEPARRGPGRPRKTPAPPPPVERIVTSVGELMVDDPETREPEAPQDKQRRPHRRTRTA
jgi:hypothetical protein